MPDVVEAAPPAATPEAPAAPPTPAEPATPGSQSETAGLSQKPTESLVVGERPAAPPLTPPSYVNPDGSFVADWTQKLPEDFADSRASLSRYKSVPELIKAYRHAEGLVGRKGLIPPTPESSPEQVAEYRKQMGVPEKAEAYAEEVKPDVQVPEGIQWDDGIAQQYFELAHRNNIPTSAMKELVQLNLKQREFELKSQQTMIGEQRQNGIMELRQTWGANFERNLGLARKAAAFYGVDQEDPGFSSPAMVKAWVRAMNDMGEGKFVGPGSSLPSGAGDFAAQAKDIQTNKDNQYYKRYWDGDPDIQSMVRNLHRKAANGGR
jgi:hypothetical protein